MIMIMITIMMVMVGLEQLPSPMGEKKSTASFTLASACRAAIWS